MTAMALVGVAVGIWIQALSGAPEYPALPPGPLILMAVAAVVATVARWRWIPLAGALLAGLILVGAFATPWTANRLSQPVAVGLFTGTVIQMLALIAAVLAGVAATAEAYRQRTSAVMSRVFGVIFGALGLVFLVRGAPEDLYHNLLHLATGLVALYLGFFGTLRAARTLCVGFGVFYLALGGLGIALGDPSLGRLWNVGPLHLEIADHGFHLVLGTILAVSGLLTDDLAAGAVSRRLGSSMAPSRT